MAINKVGATTMTFMCPKCELSRDISLAEVRLFARSDHAPHVALVLPPCACGARSDVAPGLGDGNPRQHLRRLAWKRALPVAAFISEASAVAAHGETEKFDAFYAQPGREALRAQYEDPTATVEVVTRAKE